MRIPTRRALAVLLLLAAAAVTTLPVMAQPAAGLLGDSERLLDEGRAAEALRLLHGYRDDGAGNPAFDYLYGRAALETGLTGEAIFALQRVAAVDPGFAAARVELGRAYFQRGDYASARAEFETLARENPPPAAARVINEHLTAIDAATHAARQVVRTWITAGGGYDSNANSATDANHFLGFLLDERSREAASGFAELTAGARATRRLQANDRAVNARIGAAHRANLDARFVSGTTVNGALEFAAGSVDASAAVGIDAHTRWVDGDRNSSGAGIAGRYVRRVAQPLTLLATVRAGMLRFGDGLEVRDVDQLMIAGSADWRPPSVPRATVGAALLLGRDRPARDTSPYGRDMVGVRTAIGWSFSEVLRARLSAAVLDSDYDSAFFAPDDAPARQDTLYQIGLDIDWELRGPWAVRHSVAWSSNDTDVELFDYDRFVSMVTLRRRFR